MKIQKSFHDETLGALYVVPTPIGNLEDITFRALKTLKEVAIIAAEDTRNTMKLLNHFDIHVPLISYHEHNKLKREEQLLERVKNGESIAIVSDAGMPAISDPGYELVKAAIEEDIKVVVLPGANAAICAIVGSGLTTDEFYFYGFLPRKNKEKEKELERLKSIQATLLFYESPFRVKETLQTMKKVFGGDRQVVAARELTKRFEEFIRGTIDEVIDWTNEHQLKGEFCLVLSGSTNGEESDETWWDGLTIKAHVDYYIEQNQFTSKEAIKQVAIDREVPKREVYQIFHDIKKES